MKFNTTHVFSNGEERTSLEGVVIPRTEETEAYYRCIEKAAVEEADKIKVKTA